ncbi:MAG: DUF2339 domain-containing protein [Candidatus Kapaibacteriota bacterium]
MEELFYGLCGLALVIAPFWALIATIRKTNRLEREMLTVRNRLATLERTLAPSSPQAASQAASATIAPHQLATLIDLETLKKEIPPEEPIRIEANTDAPPKQTQESPTTTAPSTSTPKPKTNLEWETLIGGRLFNRIGAAAIVIGIGFFLKYAFDNDLISEPLRVLIGVFFGIGLIAGAERLHRKKLPIFAQGLTGAGIGALYVSVYAAVNFYHLMPPLQGFAGMIGVTVISFVLALRYNALAIAIALLAWFGGYLTPLLIHSAQPNPFGLMSYLTVLSLGMLALVLRRDDWFVLKPLSFLATYSVCGAWYLNAYTTLEHFSMTLGFAVLFWVIFFGVDLYRAASGRSVGDAPWRRIDSLLNSSISYAAFFALIYDAYQSWMPFWTLGYGFAYFGASQLVRVRQPEHRFAFMRYTLTAIIQLAVATAQQFDDEWTVIAWSVEFAALFWAGAQWKRPFVMVAATALSILAFGTFFVQYEGSADNNGFISLPAAMHLVVMLAFLIVAIINTQLEQGGIIGKFTRGINIFHAFWVVALGKLVVYEISQFYQWNEQRHILHTDYWYGALIGIAYFVLAVSLAWLARRYAWKEVTWMAMIITAALVIAAVLAGFVYEPAIEWSLLLNIRVALLATGLGAVLALWKIFDTNASATTSTISPAFAPYIRPVLGASALLLLFTVQTGEASDFFHSKIMRIYALPEAVQQNATVRGNLLALENAKQLAISSVWLIYAAMMMIGGFVRRLKELRLVALGLAGIAVLKIFLYDLSFLTTPYRIASFIGLGIVLLLVSYLYQRFKDRLLEDVA